MLHVLWRFARDERGGGLVEYGLLASAAAVLAIVALTSARAQDPLLMAIGRLPGEPACR